MNEHIADRVGIPADLHPYGIAALVIGISVIVGLAQIGLHPVWLIALPSASLGASLLTIFMAPAVPTVVGLLLLTVLNALAILVFVKPDLLTRLGLQSW